MLSLVFSDDSIKGDPDRVTGIIFNKDDMIIKAISLDFLMKRRLSVITYFDSRPE